MIKLAKVTVMTLSDTSMLFPDSVISEKGELFLQVGEGGVSGIVPRGAFGKTYLVDSRSSNYLIIGEYLTNKFEYRTRMEHIPKVVCNIHKEWELQE